MARTKLDQSQQGYPPGPQPGSQRGWEAVPQTGPLPGYPGGPQPGNWSSGRRFDANPAAGGIDQAVADVVLGPAARFIGRAISRRAQRTYSERVLPAMAARRDTALRDQIAIAERHPDLRACLTDQVIFLAGGSRVVPMMAATFTMTVPQADALVAQLRQG